MSGDDIHAVSSTGCELWAYGHLLDAWNKISAGVVDTKVSKTVETSGELAAQSLPVVAVQLQPKRIISAATIAAEKEWPLFLVRGYTDGCVCVSILPSDPSPLEIEIHSTAVTAVQLVSQEYPSRLLLLTSARDGTVCVWNITQRKLLWTSRHHTKAVTALCLPPRQVLRKGWSDVPATRLLGPHFCSVAEDCCVCIHTLGPGPDGVRCVRVLGGHHSLVTYLHWSQDDDRLFVHCADGSVCIWMLEYGIMERRLGAADGLLVLQQAIKPRIGHPVAATGSPMSTGSTHEETRDNRHILLRPMSGNDSDLNGCHVASTMSHEASFYVLEFDLPALLPDLIRIKERGKNESWWLSLPRNFCAAFSFLHPWGLDQKLDTYLNERLQLFAPTVPSGLAICGMHGCVTATFPLAYGAPSQRYQTSVHAGSTALNLTVLSEMLIDVPGHENFQNQLVQVCTSKMLLQADEGLEALEKLLVKFVRSWLATPQEASMAAQRLFNELVAALQPVQRRQLAQHLAASLEAICVHFRRLVNGKTTIYKHLDVTSKCLSFFCLGRLAVIDADAIDLKASALVAQTSADLALCRCASTDADLCLWRNMAADLLGAGFIMWRPYIADPAWLMQDLFQIGCSQTPATVIKTRQRCNAILSTVVSMGVYEPRIMFHIMREQSLSAAGGSSDIEPFVYNVCAINVLTLLSQKSPDTMRVMLHEFIGILVEVMSPSKPLLRQTCLGVVTEAIASLIEQFPVVSFHQETQRIAVGLADSTVAIFDLRTARRLLVLRGHTAPITGVSFGLDSKGLHVASFCVGDHSVRCWHPSASNGHCLSNHELNHGTDWMGVRLRWTLDNEITLVRGPDLCLQRFSVPPLALPPR
jgi:WD40 repeat protein